MGPALRGVAFISYVREDSRRVDRLEKFLEANDVPVWRDTHDLRPGEDWHAKIREAIAADSLAFVACFSKNSEARQRSYQRDELLLAIEQFRIRPPESPYILPIRFDDCAIPDLDISAGRTLNSLHHVDLFGRQWQASAERLLEGIRHVLRPAPSTRRWGRRNAKPESGIPAPVADGPAAGSSRFRPVAITPEVGSGWLGRPRRHCPCGGRRVPPGRQWIAQRNSQ